MIIRVLQSHIDAGKQNECHECPVALAILEAIPAAQEVWVTTEEIMLVWQRAPREVAEGFVTPAEVRLRISVYDACGEMLPFEFELPIVEPRRRAQVEIRGWLPKNFVNA